MSHVLVDHFPHAEEQDIRQHDYAPRDRGIPAAWRSTMSAFFEGELLDRVRQCVLSAGERDPTGYRSGYKFGRDSPM